MKTMVPQTEQGYFHGLNYNGSHNIVIICIKNKNNNLLINNRNCSITEKFLITFNFCKSTGFIVIKAFLASPWSISCNTHILEENFNITYKLFHLNKTKSVSGWCS